MQEDNQKVVPDIPVTEIATTLVTETALEDMGYLLDELVSSNATPTFKEKESTVAADQTQATTPVDKVVLTVPPATTVRTNQDPAMFVWSGHDRHESTSLTTALAGMYEGNPDPETVPDPTWARAHFDAAQSTVPYADIYKKPLRNPESKWRQEYGTKQLAYANYWSC